MTIECKDIIIGLKMGGGKTSGGKTSDMCGSLECNSKVPLS